MVLLTLSVVWMWGFGVTIALMYITFQMFKQIDFHVGAWLAAPAKHNVQHLGPGKPGPYDNYFRSSV